MMIFNAKALITIVPAAVFGGMMQHSMHVSDVVAECAAGAFATGADALFRVTAKLGSGESNLLEPRAGGHIFFIPVWICGLVWIGYSYGHYLKFW
jgi:hypothetical protein